MRRPRHRPAQPGVNGAIVNGAIVTGAIVNGAIVNGAIVTGLKPGGAVRVWVVAPPGALSPALTAQIQSAAPTPTPPAVQNGPVAIGILFDAWGGGAPITNAQHPVPVPPQWTAGATGPQSVPDGVFARIWPN